MCSGVDRDGGRERETKSRLKFKTGCYSYSEGGLMVILGQQK